MEVIDIVGRTVEDLRYESESYIQMVIETIENLVSNLGDSHILYHMEEFLIDEILYAL